MSTRQADPWLFHAEGSVVSWPLLARQVVAAHTPGAEELLKRAAKAGTQVQLRWAVSDQQGLPPSPFTVWTRRAPAKERKRPFTSWPSALEVLDGVEVAWGGRAMASVTLQVAVTDPTRAVLAMGFMGQPARETLVAVASQPAGASTVSVTLRAELIATAFVVNGTVTGLTGETLAEAVNDPAWKELERVGLPVEVGDWPAGGYDTSPQGLLTAPTDPVSAAVGRLRRGAPAFGWWPTTPTGHPAPPWAAPDPAAFVAEARSGLLGEVAALFGPGVGPLAQAAVQLQVAGMVAPTQDGRTVPATTASTHYPLATLQLGTSSDPFAALGLGFGTAYPFRSQAELRDVPREDYLVTADYPRGISGSGAAETRAAFVPAPGPRAAAAPVTGLAAELAGLVGPAVRDGEWRETVRLSWDRVEPTAGLGRPSAHALCRFDQVVGAPADALLEKRDSGGWRPVAPTPRPLPSPPHPPGSFSDRIDWSTQAEAIPLGSGGRHVGYGVAVGDLYGVWSPWRDVAWDGGEPPPPTPQVVSARLDTLYAGSTTCPATLEVHLAVDWSTRTPSSVTLLGVLAPLAASDSPLPPGTTALGPPPAGAGRHDVVLTVTSPAQGLAVPAGASVDYLDPTAQNVIASPGDALQGAETRHYRLRLPLSLDFGAAQHYALALWAQEVDSVGTGSPGPAPVVARVSTPVPVTVTFPPLPVVPLGSAPDAASLSHGRISWSPFSGAATVTVWACPETALRNAAGVGAIPAGELLSVRFAELLAAYDGLDAARQRSVFRREAQVDGAATEVQVTLPPGSDEIVLYAVTATNAGNVESAWPASSDQLRAFARPRLVAPATPELVAVDDGGGTATVTVTVGGTVAPDKVQVFRTQVSGAATSVDLMGPAVAESSAFTQGPDGRWSAVLTDAPGSSWRTTWYRAVAWAADLPTNGVVGVRSDGSTPFPLLAPPDGAPDVSVPAVSFWGSDRDGVLATWSTDVPPQAGRFGASTVRVRVTREAAAPADPPSVDREARLDQLVVDPGATPPADVTGGVLQRSLRTGGRTPMQLWLRRSDPADLLTLAVTVTDPLGRSTTVSAPVPAVPPDPPPDVTLGVPVLLAGGVAVPFTSHVPLTPVLDGVYAVDVFAAHPQVLPHPVVQPVVQPVLPPVVQPAVPLPQTPQHLGWPLVRPPHLPPPHLPPPLHLRVAVPDVPVIVSAADIPPGTTIGVFRSALATHPPHYLVVAALTSPVSVRVVVTAPDGQQAEATVTA